MTSNSNSDPKKTQKMMVTIGWGVVAGVVIFAVAPHWLWWVRGITIGILVLLPMVLFCGLLYATGDLLDFLLDQKREGMMVSVYRTSHFCIVPKDKLNEAIEAIELSDTHTALSILKDVVSKDERDDK